VSLSSTRLGTPSWRRPGCRFEKTGDAELEGARVAELNKTGDAELEGARVAELVKTGDAELEGGLVDVSDATPAHCP